MRPIDADALINVHKELCEVAWNRKAAPVSWAQAYEHFVDTLEDAPTIEAGPVKHGRWIGTHDGWYYSYSCSECGIEALTKEETMHDQVCSAYCPNCGAKMDLEET